MISGCNTCAHKNENCIYDPRRGCNAYKEAKNKVNYGSIGCQNCKHKEWDGVFGYVCQHKASMEGIEAEKNFYRIQEVDECVFYDYDENSVFDR